MTSRPTASASSAASPALSIGIDFGTSNTVVALSRPGGPASVVRFHHEGRHASDGSAFISALCFWEDGGRAGKRTRVEGGPWAVEEFLEGLSNHRFIQSFKTFAASGSFQDTRIFGAKYRFEDLLHAFLANVLGHADLAAGGRSVVVGRPVRFAGGAPDEALAMRRYRAAFASLGVEHPRFVYEPVGAAFFYAQRLERDATVLVADFGGGTSDFSVIRFEGAGRARRARPLGHAGVGVAGDTFDYRIIDKVVSPRLGKGGELQVIRQAPVAADALLREFRALETRHRRRGRSRRSSRRRSSRTPCTSAVCDAMLLPSCARTSSTSRTSSIAVPARSSS